MKLALRCPTCYKTNIVNSTVHLTGWFRCQYCDTKAYLRRARHQQTLEDSQ